jgi:hypothetical protein
MEKGHVVQNYVRRKKVRPDFTHFVTVLMVEAVQVFDYFTGFQDICHGLCFVESEAKTDLQRVSGYCRVLVPLRFARDSI